MAYSADGMGSFSGFGLLQADVPAGSTVVKAFVYQSFFTSAPSDADRTITLDGVGIVTATLPHSLTGFLSSSRSDVTAQVAAKVGSGGGITNFEATYQPSPADGVGLVVVYTNPTLPEGTVAVLDGGAATGGDLTTFNFLSPIDKTVPGFAAQMSVGSGFSYQNGIPGHACGGSQFSLIDVNAQRLTSCAGNFDDGEAGNGALFTIGGVSDSTDNPVDPNSSTTGTDDELYNLAPFLHQGDTQLKIASSNPSGDDIFFLSVIQVTAKAAVTTEICNNLIDDDGDGLIDAADPDCTPPDVAAPTCSVTAVRRGGTTGHDQQDVTVKDVGTSGLKSITNIVVTNGTVTVAPFSIGTTGPVIVTATKTTQGVSTKWSFDATDVAGNVKHCV